MCKGLSDIYIYIYIYIYIRTNSDLCHLQHKLIGFYNRDEKCLQRGTDWGFKYIYIYISEQYSGLRLVCKGLNVSILMVYLQEDDFTYRYGIMR